MPLSKILAGAGDPSQRDRDEEVDGSQAWCAGSWTYGLCRNFILREVRLQPKTVRLSAEIRKCGLFTQQTLADHTACYRRQENTGPWQRVACPVSWAPVGGSGH